MIAKIVLNKATRQYDKEYSYIVPQELEAVLKPGARVIVPFGRSDKPVEAFVLELNSKQDDNLTGLKNISRLIDEKPVLEKELLELAVWMKQRYICTYGDVIRCMLPAGIGLKGRRMISLKQGVEIETDKNSDKIVSFLKSNGGSSDYEEAKKALNMKLFTHCVNKLVKSGALLITETYTAAVKEKTVKVAYIAMDKEEVADELENCRINRIQQIRVLEMLLESEYISVADIMLFAGVSSSVVNTLRKNGYIEFKDIEIKRNPFTDKVISRTDPLKLTAEQAVVFEKLSEELEKENFSETLIHGVTGSGKTEVYMQLIQMCIDFGKQALMLVPEIALTPQMVERLKGRFGDIIAVIHSKLSLGERFDQWRLIREGSIKVVVGARSAVFAPLSKLGLVIIDEEHEGSYKSEMTPRYNAKDIARYRCAKGGAMLVYGSATPSVETYCKAVNKQIGLLVMKGRANKMLLPKVEMVDMRLELKDGNRSIFSDKLAFEINENIKRGEQTILFLNRRGHSSFVLCRNCGFVLKCSGCNVAMTYHAYDDRLICHYCGYTTKSPQLCPKCRSNTIRHFGTGTQRVEEEIRKQFQGCSVIRMDMDTTTGKNSHEEILRNFRENNIDIMIGTQMIAKGHHFPNVTLVGVLAADSLLNVDDYRASERTFQLITQVSGRAGRGEIPGRVIIQTYNTEDFSILAAGRHDYESFYKQEIKIRERLNYTPFTNIAFALFSGTNDKNVYTAAEGFRENINKAISEHDLKVELLGPLRAPMAKIKNRYRWRYIFKCKDESGLVRVLTCASDSFYFSKYNGEVELSVDINPSSMV